MLPPTERAAGSRGDPLAAGEAGTRYVRGGTLRMLGYLGAVASSVVAIPFVTRHLHSANYGHYVAVTSLMLIVSALTEGGIASLGVREFATAPAGERRAFMSSLIGVRIALSVVGGAGAVVFALVAGYPGVVVEGTALAVVGLLFANLQITLAVPLTAALRLPWLAVLDFLTPTVTSLTLVLLVVLDAPFLLFFAAAAVGYSADLALTALLVRGQISLRPAFRLARWRALLRDSVVFASATALSTVYFQVVVVAMSVIATAQQTGVFGLAFRILSVIGGLPVLLAGSALPILLRAAEDDRGRLRETVQRLLEGTLLLGGWFSLLVVAGAPFAVRVLGGPGYPGAATALRILGAGVIATFIAAVLAMTLLALRAYRTLIVTSAAMIVLAIVLCTTLIPHHGADGGAVVTLTLEVVLAVAYAAILAATHRELRPRLSRAGRIAVAVAVAFAAALAAPVAAVPSALIGTAVLAAAVCALRAFPVEVIAALRPRRR